MDQIEKFLQKLDKKWALKLKKALLDIVCLNLSSHQVKKLTGHKNLYRLRLGKVRIVFRKAEEKGVPIYIEFRGRVYKAIR